MLVVIFSVIIAAVEAVVGVGTICGVIPSQVGFIIFISCVAAAIAWDLIGFLILMRRRFRTSVREFILF